MGIGPFFNEIGGKGIALIIFAFIFIAFFNSDNVIVEIKLIIVWVDLNFKFLIIFFPTLGVIAKKIQLDLLITSWLFLAISIFLNLFFNIFDKFLFLGERSIFLYLILDLLMPSITENDILPTPIKPKII